MAAEDPLLVFQAPKRILTPRLFLRSATHDDIPHLHRFLSNSINIKYMRTPLSITLDDSRHWYEKRFVTECDVAGGKQEAASGFIYLICLRKNPDVSGLRHDIAYGIVPDEVELDEEGEAIGSLGSLRLPHLGYQIGAGPDYWGKGYGTEVVRAFVQAFCSVMKRAHVENGGIPGGEKAFLKAEVDEDNTGSWKILEKVGFKNVDDWEGIEKEEGVREYRLYVKEWPVK
jgi:RimJ/RimL family protein N-acetyltransferase